MPTCCAFGCNNRSSPTEKSKEQRNIEKTRKITFHKFPKIPEKREAWIDAVSRKNWTPTNSSVICSEHFPEDCFDLTSLVYVRLRETAVPSIFKCPSYIPEKQKKKASYRPTVTVEGITLLSCTSNNDISDCEEPSTSKSSSSRTKKRKRTLASRKKSISSCTSDNETSDCEEYKSTLSSPKNKKRIKTRAPKTKPFSLCTSNNETSDICEELSTKKSSPSGTQKQIKTLVSETISFSPGDSNNETSDICEEQEINIFTSSPSGTQKQIKTLVSRTSFSPGDSNNETSDICKEQEPEELNILTSSPSETQNQIKTFVPETTSFSPDSNNETSDICEEFDILTSSTSGTQKHIKTIESKTTYFSPANNSSLQISGNKTTLLSKISLLQMKYKQKVRQLQQINRRRSKKMALLIAFIRSLKDENLLQKNHLLILKTILGPDSHM